MSVHREDPEVESILQKERSGSGNFTAEDPVRKSLRLQIQAVTPRPGPNYYSFDEHRIYCESNSQRREELVRRLEEYDA